MLEFMFGGRNRKSREEMREHARWIKEVNGVDPSGTIVPVIHPPTSNDQVQNPPPEEKRGDTLH